MSRIVFRAILFLCLSAIVSLPLFAGEFTLFGPQTFTRETGKPAASTVDIPSPVSGPGFRLKIRNGDAEESRVSSATVALNGAQVAGPSDFNQQVGAIDRTVSLQPANTLSVQLAGKPGGQLTVSITGEDNDPPQLTISAPADGGTVTADSVNVLGSVIDATPVSVSVNGLPAVVTGQSFSVAAVPLAYGDNRLTATAADLGGNTASYAITVNRPHPAPTVTLSVEPARILSGESATLRWESANADRVSIAPGIGIVAASGSLTVSPSATTTYVVTATGPGDEATAEALLSVEQPAQAPTAFISVRPEAVKPGESAVLSWSTTNADKVWIDPIGPVEPQGSFKVSAKETTTYTLTASGPGGTASAKATLTVGNGRGEPGPTVSFTANPTSIVRGQSATLSWTTQNADSVRIDPGIGYVAASGSLTVSPNATTNYTLTATGATGTTTAWAGISVKTFVTPGSFGDQYQDLIPPDATKTSYDPKRFSLITGEVKDLANQPISGVTVSVGANSCVQCHGQEYGTVKTNAEGRFTIPVEGGSTMTVAYQKPGLITSHRQVYVPWNDIAIAETIQMLPQDTAATTVTFDGNPQTIATHQSTPVNDQFGTRAATLVFSGDNKAYEVDAAGQIIRQLSSITVRATEFVTPESMPAVLPPNSAYTYCTELSVDGAERVRFDKPVTVWVDNFIGFEVGEIVPVGYYDRDKGAWIPSDNGVVVLLLDIDGDGVVDALDSDGDNFPNDLNGDGSFRDEVKGLEDPPRYRIGVTFWRFAVTHFTPWDGNWPYGPPSDAILPNPDGEPEVDQQNQEEEKKPCDISSINSYVEDRARIFHEDILVPGTDLSLHYASNRTKGFVHRIAIPVSGYNVPGSLEQIVVKVSLAGRLFERTLGPLPDQKIYIEWDGLDHLGRPVSGTVDAKVQIGFVYETVYYMAAPSWQAFADAGIERPQSLFFRTRQKITLWRNFAKEIQVAGQSKAAGNALAEGWSLSAHHSLSPKDPGLIFKGNGEISRESALGVELVVGGRIEHIWNVDNQYHYVGEVTIDAIGNIYFVYSYYANFGYWSGIARIGTNGSIKTIANIYAGQGFNGDNQPAVNAWLNNPTDLTVDAFGNVYIADSGNNRIRKIDVNGIITTVVGNGTCGFSGDGGLATEASICSPSGIALDKDGNLYISDTFNLRIRKVDASGRIRTIAGNGDWVYGGDGGPALNASFYYPGKLAVDAAGNIYVVDMGNHRIRKIDISGRITTFAGNGTQGHSPDGTKADEASFLYPTDVDIDTAGNMLISDFIYLIKINSSGTIQTIAGNPDQTVPETRNGPASNARIGASSSAVDPAGNIYVAGHLYVETPSLFFPDLNTWYGFSALWKIAPPAAFETADTAGRTTLAGSDGLAHVFDGAGTHLETKDTVTGITRRAFSYDPNGRLTGISDSLDNATHIQRDAAGRPVTITSPDGLTTYLTIDDSNHLTRIAYPGGSSYRFEYSPDGLMAAEVDPKGNRFEHIFNLTGRLTDVFDPEGGRWHYEQSEPFDSTYVVKTTGEGNVTTYNDYTDSLGVYTTTITGPSGGQTVFNRSADQLTETTALSCGMQVVDKYDFDSGYLNKFLKEHSESTPAGKLRLTLRNKSYQDTNWDQIPDRITETLTLNGKATTLLTDILAAKREATSPVGRKVTSLYDPASLLITRLAVAGLQDIDYGYDGRGRLTSLTQGGRQTLFAYSDYGYLSSITDPEHRTTTYDTDIMGRVTGIRRPDGSSIGFAYDNNGNMTVLTNPSSIAHSFDYNGNDAKTGYQAPLSGRYQYVYDRDRRLVETIFPSGRRITNAYDKDRLAGIMTPEGEIALNYLCATKLGSMSKGGEALSYGYDGKLVTSETTSGTLSQTLSYAYNNDFNVTSFTYADATANFTYDNDGLLTGADGFTISRNVGNGLPESVSGSGYSLTRTFNSYGEMAGEGTAIGGASKYVYGLTRSPSGRITSKTETVGGETINYAYIYDDLGRLTSVTMDGALVEQYQYDNVGRRTYEMNAQRGIAGRSFTFSDEDHLLTAGDTTYQYNLDGFLASKADASGTTAYTYSSRGELLKAVLPGGKVIEYVHDPQGRRIAKKVDGVVVEKYLWQGMTRLLAVYNGSNALLMRFQYADGRMPVAITKNSVTYYLSYDHVGSLRVVTDSAGSIVKRIDYDSFGNILADSNPAFAVPFGFAGGLHDRDTGLARFGYRDYDPEAGRWTAKDPIGFSGGDVDLFGYVQNNPVNLIDPTGLDWFRPQADPYVVGREGSQLVEPGKGIGKFIDDHVPAGHTFGTLHDDLVDMGREAGLPDALINIPTMLGTYVLAVGTELDNSILNLFKKKPLLVCH